MPLPENFSVLAETLRRLKPAPVRREQPKRGHGHHRPDTKADRRSDAERRQHRNTKRRNEGARFIKHADGSQRPEGGQRKRPFRGRRRPGGAQRVNG